MGTVITFWVIELIAFGAMHVYLKKRHFWDVALCGAMTVIFVLMAVGNAHNYDQPSLSSVSAISAGINALAFAILALIKIATGFGVPDMTFGSAKFATPDHAREKGLIGESGIRLGRLRNPDPTERENERQAGVVNPLHYTGQRHLLTVAPTRAGKGVSMIVPNLLTYEGSAIVIDPKGENARITYDRRAQFGRAIALDPWGISGKPGARFNPLDLLSADSPTLIEDALLIADAVVVHDGQGEAFWSDEARALIMGFVLHLATAPQEKGQRHLGRLRDILCSTPEELLAIGAAMAESDHPAVVSAAARLISKHEKELSGVLSTAQQNTHFLDSPALRTHLEASDFRFSDLKGPAPVSVYLVLPVERLSTYSRWLRMLISLGIADIARTQAQTAKPVLFILDEFAQLGRLKMVEDAYGLMAGMGLQLHAVVQDLSQLERLYDKGWQTFIGNAGVIQVFGTRDIHTAEYVSKMVGVTTRTVRSTSTSDGQSGGSTSRNFAPTQRPLLFPDELMRMDADAQILFVENADPIVADKIVWHEDAALKALAGQPERHSTAPIARDEPVPV
ncbi:type IV secretory system conjugative DNA transfer family protein [Brevundimonas sp.]|jgi:type IV secretion system protein VirD4|uniref:type IV secretory system conjugative DNA transfer family protein n=1 Tax=Brevundimonas sp. TaxID=1871086 RepID=UPI002E164892|nr:type IV secretory system conjugative DNA transfer family protein [Brevundimonas sp.]